jgi:methylglutaconyl-CoA hydratase
MSDTLVLTKDGRGVATVTLTRPDKHNAMSGEMIAALTDTASRLAGDNTVRVVVLTGAGRSFCAGGDLRWMQAQINASETERRASAHSLATMLRDWNHLPKPVIGRINGNAFGGGVGLASVCDVAIGVEGAKMGLTETKLGLIPATIGPYVVARMGAARARRVFMSSRVFDTDEGVALGLLARCVPTDTLDAAVEAEVLPYLSCAPGAVAAAKAEALRLGPNIDAASINASIDALIARWHSAEATEGLAAFFDKRAASWTLPDA